MKETGVYLGKQDGKMFVFQLCNIGVGDFTDGRGSKAFYFPEKGSVCAVITTESKEIKLLPVFLTNQNVVFDPADVSFLSTSDSLHVMYELMNTI